MEKLRLEKDQMNQDILESERQVRLFSRFFSFCVAPKFSMF